MPVKPTATSKRKFLALGDSYTAGTGLAEGEPGWPQRLVSTLPEETELTVVARNGWRTDNLMIALEEAVLSPPYDLVSLCIGVNDQYQGFHAEGFGQRFAELLDLAVELAGGNEKAVFVLTIPDYAFTPFGEGSPELSERVAEFNRIKRAVCKTANIAFVNMTDISRRGLEEPGLVAKDGLHPSGRQYELWIARLQSLQQGPLPLLTLF